MKNTHNVRISWSGIIAGLIVGLVSFLSAVSLGIAITSITGLDLYGTSVMALIWTVVSVIASSYVAGAVAMLVNRPNYEFMEVEVDEKAIETYVHKYRKDSGITGLITGSLIVLLVTYSAIGGISGAINGAVGVAGIATAGVSATAVAAGTQVDLNSYVQNVSYDDIKALIAQNLQDLDEQQIDAVAKFVEKTYNNTKADFSDVNITNVSSKINEKYTQIKNEVTGSEFVSNLENEGLTNEQAKEVQNTINNYITETEKAIEESIQAVRKAMFTTAIAYLIYIGIIVGFTVLGAKSVRHTEEEVSKEKIETKKE